MKILILTDTFTPQINGVVTSTQSFSQELEALGHEVIIGSPHLKDGPESTEKNWRFRSMPFPFQKEHRMTSPLSRRLKNFKDHKFDLIHVQTPFFLGHLGQYLGWRYGLPVVHTYHTFWEEYLHYFPVLPTKITKLLYNHLLSKTFCNRCDHVVVPSYQMHDKLLTYDITVPITVIPTGISPDPMINGVIESDLRLRFGLSKDRQFLIFVGRLGLEKNISFLVQAFALIAKDYPSLDLVVAGDGPEREVLGALAQSLGVGSRIKWLGYVTHEEVFSLYSMSEFIVFASKTETQGLSLLEGLSVGKPAVCLAAMGVEDILVDNFGGFLSDDDPVVFATYCRQLLDDRGLYTNKCQEARERSLMFSSPEMAKRLEVVYATVLNNNVINKGE